SDTTATIGGSAAGKVSTTVSYEDGDRTLVIDAISNFAASDQITISDLSFTDFTAASLPDNLELEVKDDGMTTATDDKTIAIGRITISSADNQEFFVGGPDTAISTITITEDSFAAVITAGNDIRIRIPDNFYMLWDTTDIAAVIGGTAALKVSNTVSYEDSGKTLVLNVTTDFAAADQITISGLSFTNFTAASSGDHLELEVFNDGETTAEDDKFKAIGGTPSAGSMLVYGEGSVITPRYRTWDGSDFSVEVSANDTDDVIKWVVLKPSPIEYEMIMGVYVSATKALYIQTWDGSSWTTNWSTILNYDGSFRMFDIAYEKNSGDAVVVFGDKDSKTLRYRKRFNGTWDSSDTTISAVSPDDEVYWVRAESRPGSDDVFVALSTKNKSIYALRWNGASNSWGDQINKLGTLKTENREAFDIAFESASGDALLIWGDDNRDIKYREFTTSWQSEQTAYTLPSEVNWLAAAYDPRTTGSNIAIATILEDNTFEFGAWNGSGWVGRPAAVDAPNRENRHIDVAFEGDTGEAVYGFTQDVAGDDKKKFAWRTWTSGGGFSSVAVLDDVYDEIKFVQLKADPYSDDIMAVFADKAKDLNYRFWAGSSWTPWATSLETELSDEDKNEAFMFAWKASPPTAVNLLSFTATGQNESVQVSWQTAHEINNMGFYLYRADTQDGPFTLLNDKLIPGADFTTLGQAYEYIDRDVTRGKIYYYRLVDVDTSGKWTDHGPICVDWDADGLPDDWELAHGLDPTVDDADLDADNDGLTNLEEYARGTDPNDPDSNGDGILDGDEHFQPAAGPDPGGSLSLSRGVHILDSDETGITLELRTEAFETDIVQVDGQQFEKLSIKEYVHGFTTEVGKPRLPLKGILLDLPSGQSAQVTVLDTGSTIGYGYQVYPVPQNFADDQSDAMQVAELFTMDADAYGQDVFYPQNVAGLGEVYNFRDQLKQQLIFYPVSFNPVSGQIRHYNRIRVRVDYEDADRARVQKDSPLPWTPPSGTGIFTNPIPMAPTAMAFIGPAFLNSPIISAIASLGTLAQAVWMPPDFDWTTQGPAYKILVTEAGLYRLTGSYLAAGGVNLTGVNIGQVRLYNLGTEIAVTVYDGNSDALFDGNDYIEFYATAVDSGYAKYTNNNVYWLTLAGGLGVPLRMGVINGAPAAGPDTATHYFTVHYEPDQGYWQEAPGADSLDRWFIGAIALGDQINSVNAGQPVTFNLPLVDVVDSATGTLKIMLYGGYDTDHEVAVSYEGQQLGTFAWSGYTNYEVIIEDVNFSEQIQDGNYTVAVTCLSGFDKIVFDWIAATYPREFMAYDDSLKFTHDAGYLFTIDDFSTDELMVLDITASDDPLWVDGFEIYEPVASSFSLEFETADDGQTHTYLVLA
ncbi:MAG: C25 family peptidase propeptide domain-containing protein, partial [Desulfobacterales bacterium]